MTSLHLLRPRATSLVLSVSIVGLAACDQEGNSAEPIPPSETVFHERSYHRSMDPESVRGLPRLEVAAVANESPCAPITADGIWKFIEGIDSCMTLMEAEAVSQNLNDPFAVHVLRAGKFPTTIDDISQAIRDADGSLREASYVVGEGSQIPASSAVPRTFNRNLRYVITWGPSETDAEIFLSAAPGGNSSFHQVISYDSKANKFNYYELRAQVGSRGLGERAWSWAGDTSMARAPKTIGVGCFDCHHNGIPIMKELTFPWNNWQSEAARISPTNIPTEIAAEANFKNALGADVYESVIRGRIRTYYEAWLGSCLTKVDGKTELREVDKMLRHLISTSTVNFGASAPSDGANASPPDKPITQLPVVDTLLNDSIFRETLGLRYTSPAFSIDRDSYEKFLTQHEFQLVSPGPEGFAIPGSTFFSFFTPVASAEDIFVTRTITNNRFVSKKFVAALSMVDFTNPIFSKKRETLLKYSKQIQTGVIENGESSIPGAFAALVVASQPEEVANDVDWESLSAEQQFLKIWSLPDDQWESVVTGQLTDHLAKIGNLEESEKLSFLMDLSNRRRTEFSTWPIISNLNEFSLLLPQNNLSE